MQAEIDLNALFSDSTEDYFPLQNLILIPRLRSVFVPPARTLTIFM